MNKLKSMVLVALASLGLRGITSYRLSNSKVPMAPDFKALHAEAIGIPKDKAAAMSNEDQVAAHNKHMEAVTKLVNEGEEPEGPAGETTAAANEKLVETETALANERTALANERKKTAGLLLANAIAAGKIAPADKPAWEARFESDFEKTETELANTKAAIKTVPRTSGLGKPSGEVMANEATRRNKVQGLVNAKMSTGMKYEAAFDAVQEENPALFEAMKKPEAKK